MREEQRAAVIEVAQAWASELENAHVFSFEPAADQAECTITAFDAEMLRSCEPRWPDALMAAGLRALKPRGSGAKPDRLLRMME